jgi:hypothetical protein
MTIRLWEGITFQAFQTPPFKVAVWIAYLIIDPTQEWSFNIYRFCPAGLKDQKPGPCHDDDCNEGTPRCFRAVYLADADGT